jgi:hypothetical protein
VEHPAATTSTTQLPRERMRSPTHDLRHLCFFTHEPHVDSVSFRQASRAAERSCFESDSRLFSLRSSHKVTGLTRSWSARRSEAWRNALTSQSR